MSFVGLDYLLHPHGNELRLLSGAGLLVYGLKVAVTRSIAIRHPDNLENDDSDRWIQDPTEKRHDMVDGGTAVRLMGVAIIILGLMMIFSDAGSD